MGSAARAAAPVGCSRNEGRWSSGIPRIASRCRFLVLGSQQRACDSPVGRGAVVALRVGRRSWETERFSCEQTGRSLVLSWTLQAVCMWGSVSSRFPVQATACRFLYTHYWSNGDCLLGRTPSFEKRSKLLTLRPLMRRELAMFMTSSSGTYVSASGSSPLPPPLYRDDDLHGPSVVP